MKQQIAIIGAGLAGLGLAHALLEQGLPAAELTLFERHHPGAGASGLPGGLMHPIPGRSLLPKPHYWESFSASQHWLQNWQTRSNEKLFQTRRLLRPAVTPELCQRFERSHARLPEPLKAHIFRLDTDQQPPDSHFKLPPTCWAVSPAIHVNMPALLTQMVHTLRSSGVNIRQQSIRQMEPHTHWHLTTETGTESFRQVILCPGEALTEWFPALPLACIRGELLLLQHQAFKGLSDALSSQGYLIPTSADRALAGPTFYAEAQARDQAWSLETIFGQLETCVPWIAESKVVQIWSGRRTLVQPDREPLAGPVPGKEGLFVLGALGTKGLLLLPRLAAQLSAHLLHGQPMPAEFLTTRLAERHWHTFTPCP